MPGAEALCEFWDARRCLPERVLRQPGEIFDLDARRLGEWEDKGLVRPCDWILRGPLWDSTDGRDLRVLADPPHRWARVVACLNIWNDLVALQQTYQSWYHHVDHVIAVDGAYDGVPVRVPWSTDGTVEFLQELDKVDLVETQSFWRDQPHKRTAYFRRARKDDLLFVVDADETVEYAERLREVPYLDVGWVLYRNPIYQRTQSFPRLFRKQAGLHYDGRHHWIWAEDRLVTTCQRGGDGQEHRFVPVGIDNARNKWRDEVRLGAARAHRTMQASRELQEAKEESTGGVEPLRILQITTLDPGMVVYRLHSAINTTTPHVSAMATDGRERPYEEPTQYTTRDHRHYLRTLAEQADVLHCHLSYYPLDQLGVRNPAPVVMHHHGTMLRENAGKAEASDRSRAALRLVSNFELLKYGPDLHWLPNPVPVARYRRLSERLWPGWRHGELVVAHSPSKPEIKGTDVLLRAAERLRAQGLDIRVKLIHGRTHRESIEAKARADVCFDSFWLGLQCAGLEAGAMGKPVIAGDAEVRGVYVERLGGEPYLYADEEDGLVRCLGDLATDEGCFREAASRISTYVLDHHDYGAVAARYLELLDRAVHWREAMSLHRFRGGLGASWGK